MLRAELRKIEVRKKEREKKTADLQKLIAQADTTSNLEVVISIIQLNLQINIFILTVFLEN